MHTIQLEGPAVHDRSLSGHLFRDLLAVLVDGAERSLRFTIEGRSSVHGPAPKWLRSASDFEVTGTPDRLVITARPLAVTMSDRFDQSQMFDEINPNKSPLDLFEDALEDALSGNGDSDRFDAGLLKVFQKMGDLLERGITRIRIVNGRTVDFDEDGWSRVQEIAANTYAPQKVRVAGQLNAIQHSDCRFALLLAEGSKLQGTAQELGAQVLQTHFGQQVVVTGVAVFRASGKPLRIDANRIELARPADLEVFAALPKPLLAPLNERALRGQDQQKRGLAALLGEWPGDESDEVVFAALKSVS